MKYLMICTIFFLQTVSAANFDLEFVDSAIKRTFSTVRYDGSYHSIPYPNGDVSADTGVCTDVVIRSYRSIGTDLQQLVHEDMKRHFDSYPSKRIWGLSKTDTNIDHRRVPNLQKFFKRNGTSLAHSQNPADYNPGELVTWMVSGNLPHIGIVSNKHDSQTGNPLIVHNIGRGPVLEDMLFDYPITGHYKYIPDTYNTPE